MRIGVFGGSFDPPHSAHLQVAKAAQRQLKLDQILWVPTLQPPHKNEPATPFEERVGMVRALIEGEAGALLSDIESTLPSPSYTLHTLNALKQKQGNGHDWFLIIGADNWAIFPGWHQPEAVLQAATVVVYPRLGLSLPESSPPVRILDCPEIPMESRRFREQIESDPAAALAGLPSPVSQYIRSHGLYGLPKEPV